MAEEQKQEKLVEVTIPKEVGFIFVNGIRYVGTVKVPQKQADDLQRIINDRMETVRAIHERNPQISIKSVEQIEKLFLAEAPDTDPKKGTKNDIGKLPEWQWNRLDKEYQKKLLELRKNVKGY